MVCLLLGVLYGDVLTLRCSRVLFSVSFRRDLTIVGTAIYNLFLCHVVPPFRGHLRPLRLELRGTTSLALVPNTPRPRGASSSPDGDKNLPELLRLTLGMPQ